MGPWLKIWCKGGDVVYDSVSNLNAKVASYINNGSGTFLVLSLMLAAHCAQLTWAGE